jgi:hypothetical protein
MGQRRGKRYRRIVQTRDVNLPSNTGEHLERGPFHKLTREYRVDTTSVGFQRPPSLRADNNRGTRQRTYHGKTGRRLFRQYGPEHRRRPGAAGDNEIVTWDRNPRAGVLVFDVDDGRFVIGCGCGQFGYQSGVVNSDCAAGTALVKEKVAEAQRVTRGR